MISISINLTDLPRHKITKAKNGKSYINLIVAEMKQADQHGNTHTVFVSQSKEERAANEKKSYCGNGKQLSAAQPAQQINNSDISKDGLPF
ncbi:MAG TPA: hypothetical protein PL085_11720 [Agriterribacter sp.]|uniref:hypothetical protein n=1 Tax=Agriterribacter sp. TaxID=2821509 RepID=UPI002BDFE933|nr:hypothetical protein [Agriterribacter sp.]HRQ17737.1 hypothetical protein [Agriterribacter sp.]